MADRQPSTSNPPTMVLLASLIRDVRELSETNSQNLSLLIAMRKSIDEEALDEPGFTNLANVLEERMGDIRLLRAIVDDLDDLRARVHQGAVAAA